MNNIQSLESIRSAMNWSDSELHLVGYCVVSFERVTFLLSSLLKDSHEEQLALLDKTGGQLAEDVKQKFGENSIGYRTFKDLVNDRNAIIHAFGFPNIPEEEWNRLYVKRGVMEKNIDEEFMRKFIKRCFDFFPVRDLRRDIKEFVGERRK